MTATQLKDEGIEVHKDQKKMGTKKARLNLEFSQKTKDQLELLRKRSDSATVTEVIRRAVALFDLYTEAREDGYDLVFRKADGSGEEEVVKALF
jgi:hypothetical protein